MQSITMCLASLKVTTSRTCISKKSHATCGPRIPLSLTRSTAVTSQKLTPNLRDHRFENIHRVKPCKDSSPTDGSVHLVPSKALWISSMWAAGLVGGALTASPDAAGVFLLTSGITLCGGHSLGMHRRLIHNSFDCPLWLERVFIWLGTLVGMAGPYGMIRTHDLRDWAQRQPACHDYFAHRGGILRDGYWQLMCDVKLSHPPQLQLEPRIAHDRFLQWLERTWMLQQVPVTLLMYLLGGWAYIFWAVCLRVAVSVTGHWFVGYFAHNVGHKSFHVEGASVQGYNVRPLGSKVASHLLSIASFGESLHNNHHAFPGSARLSQKRDEIDVGWWVLLALQKLGLVSNVRVPSDLPPRPELKTLTE